MGPCKSGNKEISNKVMSSSGDEMMASRMKVATIQAVGSCQIQYTWF